MVLGLKDTHKTLELELKGGAIKGIKIWKKLGVEGVPDQVKCNTSNGTIDMGCFIQE